MKSKEMLELIDLKGLATGLRAKYRRLSKKEELTGSDARAEHYRLTALVADRAMEGFTEDIKELEAWEAVRCDHED